jgi:hypothetical protein
MAALYWSSPSFSLESHLWDEMSQYQHSFGGPPRHDGVIHSGCSRPLHMLFNIDLADPHCRLALPQARILPLYYGFQYDSTPLWYRVTSDSAIEIVRQDRTRWLDDFPYKGYPEMFRELPFAVGNPFPVNEYLEQELVLERWSDNVASMKGYGRKPDHNDLIACVTGLWQGAPKTPCINPKCDGRQMDILAVIEHDAVDGANFWDDSGNGPEVQIVFEICPLCSLIHATNQCD